MACLTFKDTFNLFAGGRTILHPFRPQKRFSCSASLWHLVALVAIGTGVRWSGSHSWKATMLTTIAPMHGNHDLSAGLQKLPTCFLVPIKTRHSQTWFFEEHQLDRVIVRCPFLSPLPGFPGPGPSVSASRSLSPWGLILLSPTPLCRPGSQAAKLSVSARSFSHACPS